MLSYKADSLVKGTSCLFYNPLSKSPSVRFQGCSVNIRALMIRIGSCRVPTGAKSCMSWQADSVNTP